eukprot:31332-Pelagococcus_subviridis.AAC.2
MQKSLRIGVHRADGVVWGPRRVFALVAAEEKVAQEVAHREPAHDVVDTFVYVLRPRAHDRVGRVLGLERVEVRHRRRRARSRREFHVDASAAARPVEAELRERAPRAARVDHDEVLAHALAAEEVAQETLGVHLVERLRVPEPNDVRVGREVPLDESRSRRILRERAGGEVGQFREDRRVRDAVVVVVRHGARATSRARGGGRRGDD